MRIAVTGGAGFIGGHLIVRLVEMGAGEIVVVDNFHRPCVADPQSPFGAVKFHRVDIRDASSLAETMRGCSVMFRLRDPRRLPIREFPLFVRKTDTASKAAGEVGSGRGTTVADLAHRIVQLTKIHIAHPQCPPPPSGSRPLRGRYRIRYKNPRAPSDGGSAFHVSPHSLIYNRAKL